jgi:hypothetical protein
MGEVSRQNPTSGPERRRNPARQVAFFPLKSPSNEKSASYLDVSFTKFGFMQ